MYKCAIRDNYAAQRENKCGNTARGSHLYTLYMGNYSALENKLHVFTSFERVCMPTSKKRLRARIYQRSAQDLYRPFTGTRVSLRLVIALNEPVFLDVIFGTVTSGRARESVFARRG